MLMGLTINTIYPLVGVTSPLSPIHILSALGLVLTFLSIACYFRDEKLSNPDYISLKTLINYQILSLILLPVLSIVGTYLVKYHQNNIVLIFMLIYASIIIILIGFGKCYSEQVYPIALWLIALALIWHTTLSNSFLNVGDVLVEYFYSNQVVDTHIWKAVDGLDFDWNVYNSTLSIVVLAPILHAITNLDTESIFGVVYPAIYSFIIFGVYLLHKIIFGNARIATASTLLVLSIHPFFIKVPTICKQGIGEFFLILFLLVLFTAHMSNPKKIFLALIFYFSLVVSHYGTTYIIIFALTLVFIGSSILDIAEKNKWIKKIYFTQSHIKINGHRAGKNVISVIFLAIMITLPIGWYLYNSVSSAGFDLVVIVLDNLSNMIQLGFFNPEASRGMDLISRSETSLVHLVNKYIYYFIQGVITIGVVKALLNVGRSEVNRGYILLSAIFILILLAAIALSGFAVMDPQRLFHLSSLVIAPFFAIGFLGLTKLVLRIYKSRIIIAESRVFTLICLILAIFLLFNTEVVATLTNSNPSSLSINQEDIKLMGDDYTKAKFYGSFIIEANVLSGRWLSKHWEDSMLVYRGDFIQAYPSLLIYADIPKQSVRSFGPSTKVIENSYIQLSYLNIVENLGSDFYVPLQKRTYYDFDEVEYLLASKDKIYTCKNSEILLAK